MATKCSVHAPQPDAIGETTAHPARRTSWRTGARPDRVIDVKQATTEAEPAGAIKPTSCCATAHPIGHGYLGSPPVRPHQAVIPTKLRRTQETLNGTSTCDKERTLPRRHR